MRSWWFLFDLDTACGFNKLRKIFRIVPILVVRTTHAALRMPMCGRMGLEPHLSASTRPFEATCWNYLHRGMYAHAVDSVSLREFAARAEE